LNSLYTKREWEKYRRMRGTTSRIWSWITDNRNCQRKWHSYPCCWRCKNNRSQSLRVPVVRSFNIPCWF